MAKSGYFPKWERAAPGATVWMDQTLPFGQTVIMGAQHVVAMFGSTVLAPILMGFDPNLAVLFSGIGTLIFFIITGGRLPSYVGSSFAFIGVVIAVTGYSGTGLNENISLALGGIVVTGIVYTIIGAITHLAGTHFIEILMPPVVTGAVVAAIGLNLSGVAMDLVSTSGYAEFIGILTVLIVAVTAVYGTPLLRRIPILVGALAAYVIYLVTASSFGVDPIDFSRVKESAWIGMPHFVQPTFSTRAIWLIVPVVFILVAENLGHIKAVAAMAEKNLDPYIGRGFMGDGIATIVAGFGGGTGVTTYAENLGVMAVTRVYSTLVFVAAAGFAIVLGFSPKFGAVILSIPAPVLGGLAIVVFGLIAATAGRIWVDNRVDFSDTTNLLTVGVAVILGAGDFKISVFGVDIAGIGTATFGSILLYHILRIGHYVLNKNGDNH